MLLKNVQSPQINFSIVQYITGKKSEVAHCIERASADISATAIQFRACCSLKAAPTAKAQ